MTDNTPWQQEGKYHLFLQGKERRTSTLKQGQIRKKFVSGYNLWVGASPSACCMNVESASLRFDIDPSRVQSKE